MQTIKLNINQLLHYTAETGEYYQLFTPKGVFGTLAEVRPDTKMHALLLPRCTDEPLLTDVYFWNDQDSIIITTNI